MQQTFILLHRIGTCAINAARKFIAAFILFYFTCADGISCAKFCVDLTSRLPHHGFKIEEMHQYMSDFRLITCNNNNNNNSNNKGTNWSIQIRWKETRRPDADSVEKNGKCVTWDVTVTDTLAQSYLSSTSSTSSGAAEAAADRKSLKYAQLAQTYIFVPIAMETFGPLNMAGFQFLNELGRRISQESDDSRECAFLFQRLSMTIQRFNAVAIQGTFAMHTPTEDDINDI